MLEASRFDRVRRRVRGLARTVGRNTKRMRRQTQQIWERYGCVMGLINTRPGGPGVFFQRKPLVVVFYAKAPDLSSTARAWRPCLRKALNSSFDGR